MINPLQIKAAEAVKAFTQMNQAVDIFSRELINTLLPVEIRLKESHVGEGNESDALYPSLATTRLTQPYMREVRAIRQAYDVPPELFVQALKRIPYVKAQMAQEAWDLHQTGRPVNEACETVGLSTEDFDIAFQANGGQPDRAVRQTPLERLTNANATWLSRITPIFEASKSLAK